jgi:hypothetical protein
MDEEVMRRMETHIYAAGVHVYWSDLGSFRWN